MAERLSAVPAAAALATFFKDSREKTSTGKKSTEGWLGKDAPAPKDPRNCTLEESYSFAKAWLNDKKVRLRRENTWRDRKYLYQIDNARHHGNMVEIEVFHGKHHTHQAVLDCFGRKIKGADKSKNWK